ncbi:MAG: hypothetical protein E7241_08790 [Lachnospiraceae bacterium]|jgi:hypothetical protein|nr:hypothetical protein [Lachnospiraceae bacterium]
MSINTTNNINGINNAFNAYKNTLKPDNKVKKEDERKDVKETKSAEKNEQTKKAGNYGKTIGNAKLSKEGAKYYEELKKKFGNMDFILVSADMKEKAQANAGAFANPSKMVVLIDEEKIEKMATDETFRAQYEGLIEKAAANLTQLKTSMDNSGQSSNILGYGLQLKDDGEISYFAVLRKSAEAQKEHIEKVVEKHQAEKKAAAKKAEKEAAEERLRPEDTVFIQADSIEELMQKVSEYNFTDRSDAVQTEQELQVGQSIDFKG